MDALADHSGDVTAEPERSGPLSHALSNWPEREVAASLPPQLFAIFVGTYAAMLIVLWLVFGTDTNAAITLGVATVYFAMYFGIPLVMNRLARQAAPPPPAGSFSRFLAGDVETNTGVVSAWGAIAQLLTIPVGLTFAFIAIGIISRLAV